MTTLAFDSLRYARRLRDAGVPESQAEAQAELMAEAFGFYADNVVTLHSFMLGLIVLVQVVPQLQAWLGG